MLLAGTIALPSAPAQAEDIDISGLLNVDLGLGFDGDEVVGRASLIVNAEARPADWISLTGIVRVQADIADKFEPDQPSQNNRSHASRRLFIGDEAEIELREFYADISIDDIYIRVGKQQIVWGQADGLKVLDVVNPQSFREFILDDFDSSRTPLWSLSAQIPVGELVAEFVWVPDTTYHDVPERDAYFAIRSPLLILPPTPGKAVVVEEADRPNRVFADSDVGLNLTALVGSWDLSLNYLYQYNNLPATMFAEDIDTVFISSQYFRTHMIGGSFSTSAGDFTFRGEVAYFTDRAFTIDRTVAPSGNVRTGEFSYVLGVDWTGLSDTFASVQLFQSYLPSYTQGTIRDRWESNMTFLIRRTFNHDQTKAEIRGVTGLNRGDGYVEFSIDHDLSDTLTIGARAVIFYGDRFGLLGQFSEKDFFVLSAKVNL